MDMPTHEDHPWERDERARRRRENDRKRDTRRAKSQSTTRRPSHRSGRLSTVTNVREAYYAGMIAGAGWTATALVVVMIIARLG